MTDAELRGFIEQVKPHTSTSRDTLLFLARAFCEAHERVPGGLSIEVGSCRGGSALLMLLLLERLYVGGERPMLHTVDPYGNKPYFGGDRIAVELYSEDEYVAQKQLLSRFFNHTHWYLTSFSFLNYLAGVGYWFRRELHYIQNLTFVFLDGDHDAKTIDCEIRGFSSLMAPGGAIVIDNIFKDPETIDIIPKDAVISGEVARCTF